MSNEDWQGLSAWKQETFMVRNGLSARYSLSFISLMLSFKSLLHVSFPASCNFVFSAGVLPFRWTIHENLDAFTPFKVEAGLTSKSLGIFVNNFFTVSLTEKQKYSSEMWGQSAGICM